MKLLDAAKKFVKGIPSDVRALRVKALDRLGGNTASNYKYTYHMQAADLVAIVAAVVGGVALLSPAGLAVGLGALALSGGIAAYRYPTAASRKTEVIADINDAGQQVAGPRADVYRLDIIQRQLRAVTAPFNKAAALPEIVAEKVQKLIDKSAALRARVKSADGQPYALVRPVTRLEKV